MLTLSNQCYLYARGSSNPWANMRKHGKGLYRKHDDTRKVRKLIGTTCKSHDVCAEVFVSLIFYFLKRS
uniref:Uncharacterized protein n=1 Tax=Nelumbo nucifera TaxID=4432 RepID=A0A822Y1K4_NELNU|nr:TPA_asm: hypothetical protein HUJ06_027331 [Nelumbo nucifera]